MNNIKSTAGVLIVISAPSGCGKTTIVNKLLSKHSDWVRSISATTRAPRGGEVDGKDYFFLSADEFAKRQKDGSLLESATVFEKSYGTPKDFVMGQYGKGKCVVLTLDIQGAEKVREKVQGNAALLTIFILPPSLKVLRERLEGRKTETPENIEKRIKMAQDEIKAAGDYDRTVVNQNLDDTVSEIEKIIEEFRK